MSAAIKHIRTASLDVAYEESGNPSGNPVFLMHGWPYDPRDYDAVLPALGAAGCRIIVPYLRGYGATRFLSAATPRSGQQAALGNDLRELMDALSAQCAVLPGYDWGGRAACIVSALWPERVRGLVTGNSYNIQDIPNSGRPASPEQEHRLWYQYYFSTERGRAGLEANRKAFCRLLWKLWSPHWAFDDVTFERSARSFDNPDFVAVTIQKPVSLRCQPRFVSAKPIYRSLPIRLILEIDVGRLLSIGVEDAAAVSFICWSLNRLN